MLTSGADPVVGLIFWLFVIFVIFLVIKYGVRAGVKPTEIPKRRPIAGPAVSLPQPIPPTLRDGPGRYRVSGVDRNTRMDTTWHTPADSAMNAKVKAELEGIIVTYIERDDL